MDQFVFICFVEPKTLLIMKNRILLSIVLLLFPLIRENVKSQAPDTIAFSTFGTISLIANPQNTTTPPISLDYGIYRNNGVTGYYIITGKNDTVNRIFNTKNGYWLGGADSSVRTEVYFVDAATRTWPHASTNHHLCLTRPERYNGAWDTMYWKGICIKGYENLSMSLAWGKRNFWDQSSLPADIRGLRVEYRVDNGDWQLVDTNYFKSPLDFNVWALDEFLLEDVTGDTLELRFTSRINQLAVDDILIIGEKKATGVKELTNNNDIKIYVLNNRLFISTENKKEIAVTVYDITGKEVYRDNNFVNGTYLGLKSGIYIVKATSNKNTKVQKVLVK